jgi:hypothetical protein
MKKFYVDASIWVDLMEDRKGFRNEPLGYYALKLFALIKTDENTILIDDFLICQKYTTSLLTGGQSPNPFL